MSVPNFRASRLLASVVASLALATVSLTSAQTYPDKPVRLLVGFAPGGGSELSARVLAEKLGTRLGQPVVIDARAGAAGQIALDAAAAAAPDGYTLSYTAGVTATILPLLSQVRYDVLRDFTAVSSIAKQPLVLAAAPQLGVSDLAGLRKKLVAEPDQHAYGSAGIGTGSHIGPAYLAQLINAKLTHVPYKSSAAALPDLMAGRLSIHIDSLSVLGPLIRQSRVVGIAIMDKDRIPGLQLPTIAEAGLPEYLKYDWTSWFIVLAPKGTPAPVVDRLNREINAALRDEDLIKRYREFGLTPTPRTPSNSAQFLEEQVKAWPPVFRSMGISQ